MNYTKSVISGFPENDTLVSKTAKEILEITSASTKWHKLLQLILHHSELVRLELDRPQVNTVLCARPTLAIKIVSFVDRGLKYYFRNTNC